MFRTITFRIVATALVAASVALAVVETASAVLPGRNGRIAFTSGREGANDNLAKIFFRETIGSTASGPLAPDPIDLGAGQSRHASWSPDRTKVVFANGDGNTQDYDLFVWDMVKREVSALDLLEIGDGKSSDHPAWSPDGTRIAYERSSAAGSANREIMVKTVGTGAPAVPLTNTAQAELKPAWSPDSQTLYYARQNGTPQKSNYDIYEMPAVAGGTAKDFLVDPDVDEYQPAISADGERMCFTRQSKPGDTASANINVTPVTGTSPAFIASRDDVKGDINCTWSPDGKRIAYTNGTFMQGRLVMVDSDNSTIDPVLLEDDMGSNNFDGNADWAPDGSPECPDQTVTTKPGEAITLVLECPDTGPAYEQTDTSAFYKKQPANGTLSDDQPTANPSTVKYTPKPGFEGTDTVDYSAFDKFGFGTDDGKVTIKVEEPATGDGGTPDPGGQGPGPGPGGDPKATCAGVPATIVGTSAGETLVGTRRRDVIVARGGKDVIRAGRGNDLVCAGRGNDRVSGGSGKDRLFGGKGRDRLNGGKGRDRLSGGKGRDRCTGGTGRDRGARCEIRRRIP